MLILLSPAKTFHKIPQEELKLKHTLVFKDKTQTLIDKLCTYDKETLSLWMKMSYELAEVNQKRYQQLKSVNTQGFEAIEYFNGEVFRALNISSIDEDAKTYLNKHLLILSGLYGCVHPSDIIQPYRLEMATKFEDEEIKDLYKYWKKDLTAYILRCLEEQNEEKVLINLASNEYSKAVDLKAIQKKYPVITISFKEETKENTYKVVGMYAKKARGNMVRYIAENQVQTVEELGEYNIDGYTLNEKLSTENHLIFTRLVG